MALTQVSGFSSITNPENLLANGNFRIDYRRLYYGSQKQYVGGQYVTDMWYLTQVQTLAPDYLLVQSFPENGALHFKGSGRKGQYISMRHRDREPYGIMHSAPYPRTGPHVKSLFTTGFTVLQGASTPLSLVPILCQAYAKGDRAFAPVLRKDGVATTENPLVHPMIVYTEDAEIVPTNGAELVVALMADGNFDFLVTDAYLVAGGYKNPPKGFHVHTGDNYDKCARYYQEGRASIIAVGRTDSTNYLLGTHVDFSTFMALPPSVYIDEVGVYEETDSPTNHQANYTGNGVDVTNRGFRLDKSKAIGGNKPSVLFFDWTAEVL